MRFRSEQMIDNQEDADGQEDELSDEDDLTPNMQVPEIITRGPFIQVETDYTEVQQPSRVLRSRRLNQEVQRSEPPMVLQHGLIP